MKTKNIVWLIIAIATVALYAAYNPERFLGTLISSTVQVVGVCLFLMMFKSGKKHGNH